MDERDTRRALLVEDLDLSSLRCLEIGALASPIVTPDDGDVRYVDWADTPTLRARYRDDPHVDVDAIVEVDAVWGDERLADALAGETVDLVLASHVVEHVPDVITWLQEVAEVLAPGGQVRLAVPDRRYTFDLLRRETTLADVLAPHVVGARIPQPREIIDFALHHAEVNAGLAWRGEVDRESLRFTFRVDEAMGLARDAVEHGNYHDVHCWVFTPGSFAALMEDLATHDLTTFACVGHTTTPPGELEFGVHLAVESDRDTRVAGWRRMQEAVGHQRDDRLAAEEELHRLRASLAAAEERLQERDAEVVAARAVVHEFQTSFWWRLTGPLRRLVELVRRR